MIAHVKYLPHILVLAGGLALAGCGGSSSDDDQQNPPKDPPEGFAALSDAEKAAACAADGLKVNAAGTACEADTSKADKEKETAKYQKLFASLRGSFSSTNGENGFNLDDAPTLTSTTLEINRVQSEAGNLVGAIAVEDADPTAQSLKKSDETISPLDGWKGAHYSRKTGSGSKEKTTHEARVYTSQGDPTESDLTGREGAGHIVVDSNPEYLLISEVSEFVHSGTKTHPIANGVRPSFTGKYSGASGRFTCVSGNTCTSTNDNEGSPSALVGTWHFFPSSNNPKTSTPDASYTYYGWWIEYNDDGEAAATGSLRGVNGIDEDSIALGWTTAPTATAGLSGPATYTGKAAGKYAIDTRLSGTATGGHFTADAELKAEFSGDNLGVTGTIDAFQLNDKSDDPDWSIELKEGKFADDGIVNGGITAWSIGDNTAGDAGDWNAVAYDEKLTGDENDNSDIPSTVVGNFHSSADGTHRIVGGFGVNHSE